MLKEMPKVTKMVIAINRSGSGNNKDDICVINDSDSKMSNDEPVSAAFVLKEIKY